MEDIKKITEISATRILGLLTLITTLVSLIGIGITRNYDSEASFWVLITLFGFPALIYVAVCIRSIVRGGVKFFIFRERKEIIKSEPKEEISEDEKQRRAIKEKELKRTEKEKYSTSALRTKWIATPLLMFFGAGLYVAVVYFSNGKNYPMDVFNTTILIIGALGILNIFMLSLEDSWEKTLEIKREIFKENSDYKFYEGYNYGLVYTDSKFNYLIFKLGKVLAYILGSAGLAILAGIGIYWISGISISPTTIIIFLLIMIYFEVSKRK